MPLGVVLLFPFTIVMLLLVLFLRHPNSPGRMLLPSRGPPAIRYVQKPTSPTRFVQFTNYTDWIGLLTSVRRAVQTDKREIR